MSSDFDRGAEAARVALVNYLAEEARGYISKAPNVMGINGGDVLRRIAQPILEKMASMPLPQDPQVLRGEVIPPKELK